MKKCKIDCSLHTQKNREFEITSDGRVWPCCYYANAWDAKSDPDSRSTQLYMSDTALSKLYKDDPDWNNLEKHSLDEIIDHEIYWTHLWLDGWESDYQAPLCVEECSVYINEITGENTTKSRLD